MDFALILFIALVITGVVVLWDRLLGARKGSINEGNSRSTSSGAGEYVTQNDPPPRPPEADRATTGQA